MDYKEPHFEYIAIGIHASPWIVILAFTLTGKNLILFHAIFTNQSFVQLAGTILLIPFFYIIGTLMDQISFTLLNPFRLKIKNKIIPIAEPKYYDECLANKSEFLYNEYRKRILKIRILGAAALNWLLTGIIFITYQNVIEKANKFTLHTLIAVLLLIGISLFSWFKQYKRAYTFRKNACDGILNCEENEKR